MSQTIGPTTHVADPATGKAKALLVDEAKDQANDADDQPDAAQGEADESLEAAARDEREPKSQDAERQGSCPEPDLQSSALLLGRTPTPRARQLVVLVPARAPGTRRDIVLLIGKAWPPSGPDRRVVLAGRRRPSRRERVGLARAHLCRER